MIPNLAFENSVSVQSQKDVNTLNKSIYNYFKGMKCEISQKISRYSYLQSQYANCFLFTGNYMCEKCGKSFKTENTLQKHRLTHGEKTIQCPDCPATFNLKENLNAHHEIHRNIKYKCNQCSVICTTKKSLFKHMSE